MVVTYSDELKKAMQKAEETMLSHARAIGELCISWAALDNAVDSLFEPLLSCDRGTAASVAAGMDKLEARIGIIRRLLIHQKLDGPWRDWVEGLFKRILEELAPLRNRYVHDQWTLRKGEPLKIDKRARVLKPQSRQPDQLIFDASNVTPTEAVDRLRAYVDTVLFALEFASGDLKRWRTTGRTPRPLSELIPACKPRTRLDHFPIILAWSGEQPLPFSFSTDT
jgi:hypothetical protein